MLALDERCRLNGFVRPRPEFTYHLWRFFAVQLCEVQRCGFHHRANMFERFVHDEFDATTGSGLGLAIVQRVAGHLGWRVFLEDSTGYGTRFVIKFDS